MAEMNVLQLTEKLKPIYRLRPGTYKQWSKAIKPIAHMSLDEVSEEVVLDYRLTGQQHLSDGTLKTRISILKGIWCKARKWKIVRGENPWEDAADGLVSSERDPECHPWEFYEYYHNDPYFNCLWYSGMRIGELAGITKENIVLDAPIAYFNLVDQSNRTLKNKQSIRKIPIHSACKSFVERLKQSKGNPPGRGWSNRFNKNLGLPKGEGAHTLRHSFTTRMREAGCDPYVLDRLTGHATKSETAKYGRYSLEVLSRELEKLQ